MTRSQRVLIIIGGQATVPGAFGVIPEGLVTLVASPGSSSTAAVVVARPASFAGAPITLTVSGLPNGVTASVPPAPIAGQTAAIALTRTGAVTTGDYSVTVTATIRGQTVSEPMVLRITP